MGMSRKRYYLLAILLFARSSWAVCTSTDGYSQAVCATSPTSYWRMSNAGPGNNEEDVSGNGNTISYTASGATRVYNCVIGSNCNACANFASASSAYAQLTNDTSTSLPCSGGAPRAWSLEAWVYGHDGVSNGVVASRNTTVGVDANTSTYSLAWNSVGGFNYNQYQTGTATSLFWTVTDGGTRCSANTWCMIDITVTAAPLLTGYLNASSTGTASSGTGSCGGDGKIQNFDIGQIDATSPTFLNGTVDEISLYSTTLSGGQITTHYNAGVQPGACSGDWPCTVLNTFPPFMNDGYMQKVVERGYTTGLFSGRAKLPQYLNIAWMPFTALPAGNVR